jgi:hypothetical protein
MLLLPKLNLPKTDKADPMRQKDRMDTDEPKCRKSSTESVEPRRAYDLMAREDPK